MARSNINQPPSPSDWENLGAIRKEEKTNILYLYLYENMNMEEVAAKVYGARGISESNNVSNVMRCYGFSGRNSGRYKNKLHYELDCNDFQAFVNQYPGGCYGDWPNHQTMDDFMRERHISKVNRNHSGYEKQRPDDWNEKRKQDRPGINERTGMDSHDANKNAALVICSVAVIAAIIFIISVIKRAFTHVIDNVSLLSYVYSEFGLLGIVSLACMLGAVLLLIIGIFFKKFRKLVKIIVPLFAAGCLYEQVENRSAAGVIILVCVAVAGYYFGLWLEKK